MSYVQIAIDFFKGLLGLAKKKQADDAAVQHEKAKADVEREIAPYVRRRGGNAASLIASELQEAQDGRAATLQGWDEILR